MLFLITPIVFVLTFCLFNSNQYVRSFQLPLQLQALGRNSLRDISYSRLNAQHLPEGPFFGPETTPLLDTVRSPADLKRMSVQQLKQLSHELRWDTLRAVSKTGGHLGSSLGVVELTVALHYIFSAPEDRIVWDVAHQAYPHKILTGRRERLQAGTLRQLGGVLGFTSRAESEYDCFGAGHSSTSISAALGMAVGKQRLKKSVNNCIAVIGDGAITGGMAYEAMNNAAYINTKMLVVLNDNGQVSLPTGQPSAGGVVPAGALSGYTSRLLTSSAFKRFRDVAKGLNQFMPEDIQSLNKRFDEYVRGMASGGPSTLFEELGFFYVGPVDAHDLDLLLPVLENIRDNVPDTKPVLLHIKSIKGKGYPPAEAASDRYHGVAKFDVATGKQHKTPEKTLSYTAVFSNALIALGEQDKTVHAVTAAMPGGTGLDKFGRRFPKRTYDVGIAEQHAVTFSAGMAVEGLKPFCAIYSTFMQRALDQVIHDVALQRLPVRMVLDRAGMVGNDGATHHGTFDLAYMAMVPDIVIMAPSHELALQDMIETQYTLDSLPSVVRFPRGAGYGEKQLRALLGDAAVGDAYKDGVLQRQRGEALPLGKGCIIKRAGQPCGVGLDVGMEMKTSTSETHTSAGKVRVAILSIGTRLVEALQAAQELEGDIGSDKGTEIAANDDNNNHNNNNNNNEKERDTREDHVEVGVTVADARFMKPLDKELLRELARTHDALLTVEEGSVGGFGAHVLQFLAEDGLLDGPRRLCVRTMHVPDEFIEAGTQRQQYDIAQLNQQHIVQKVRQLSKGLCPPSRQRSIEVADSGSGHEQQQYRPRGVLDVKAETTLHSTSRSP